MYTDTFPARKSAFDLPRFQDPHPRGIQGRAPVRPTCSGDPGLGADRTDPLQQHPASAAEGNDPSAGDGCGDEADSTLALKDARNDPVSPASPTSHCGPRTSTSPWPSTPASSACPRCSGCFYDDGSLFLIYLKITDDQYLELFPEGVGDRAPGKDITAVNHFCLSVENIERSVEETGRGRRDDHTRDPLGASTAIARHGSRDPGRQFASS